MNGYCYCRCPAHTLTPTHLEQPLPQLRVLIRQQPSRHIGVRNLQEVELGGQGQADALLHREGEGVCECVLCP